MHKPLWQGKDLNSAFKMRAYVRILIAFLCGGMALAVLVLALLVGAYYYVEPGLPDAEEMREVRLQIPLTVYSRDGRLMAQLGEKRRTPVSYDAVPQTLVQAVLAAEDDRFFEHPGFDYQGIIRAGINFALTGSRRQGGSTITQQLARMYFLTRERTFVRKFKELILATRIEREFTKREILELYLNRYFFGQRAYGVAAAAQVYFGKSLSALDLSESAIIAGIPQAPSRLNPVSNPDLATQRRAYVLRRMRELNFISLEEYEEALAKAVVARRHGPQVELEAPYAAEVVRAEMIRRFGPAAYTEGYRVTTTVDSRLQRSANQAVREVLLQYDRRHGYRGPVEQLLPESLEVPEDLEPEAHWQNLLRDYREAGPLRAALVTAVTEDGAEVFVKDVGPIYLALDGVEWAAPYLSDDSHGEAPERVDQVLAQGDIVRVLDIGDGEGGSRWQLGQMPEAQAALVALDPMDGGVAALVGGFDYFASKYNRATQARRQPGSSFKPFIYSAALENGFTAASIVNDSPVVFHSDELEDAWRPENYSRKFHGDIRLREALVKSLNLVSVRIMVNMGVGPTVRHVRRFGFNNSALPRNPSLALGAGNLTPLQLAAAYSTFANGGYRVDDYLIQRIEDAEGNLLFEAEPAIVCADCEGSDQLWDEPREEKLIEEASELYPSAPIAPRVITAQNAYLINHMMRDVVRRGTGVRAYRELQREDIAGKTGTSNDRRDTWFSGFNGDLVATVWVGFDQERSLGAGEQGGVTALPAWNLFMADALEGAEEKLLAAPTRPCGCPHQ